MEDDTLPPIPQIIEFRVLQDRRRMRGTCWHRRFEIDREGGAVFSGLFLVSHWVSNSARFRRKPATYPAQSLRVCSVNQTRRLS